ncbi:MAG: hypothetical protein ACFB0D_02030 [Phormidesmis sp.]
MTTTNNEKWSQEITTGLTEYELYARAQVSGVVIEKHAHEGHRYMAVVFGSYREVWIEDAENEWNIILKSPAFPMEYQTMVADVHAEKVQLKQQLKERTKLCLQYASRVSQLQQPNTSSSGSLPEISRNYLKLEGPETSEPYIDVALLTDNLESPIVAYCDEDGAWFDSNTHDELMNPTHYAELPNMLTAAPKAHDTMQLGLI